MRREWKKLLQEAYRTPAPQRKDEFFRRFRQSEPEITTLKFVLTQAAYIRKSIWILSAATFFLALYGVYADYGNVMWLVSALIPFLAVMATAENMRSIDYGMAELEMVSCFSLKSVVLARLTILGAAHTLLLIGVTPLNSIREGFTLLQAGVYLLVPYLLTTVISLEITRRIHGKEAVYTCMCVAVIVSVMNGLGKYVCAFLYGEIYLNWWVAVLVVLVVYTASAICKMIHQTEEMTWKLS